MNGQAQHSRCSANAQSVPTQRVEALLACRSRPDQIRLLCDTRPLHRLLVRLSDQRRPHGGAGRYRGVGEPVFVYVNVRPEAPMISNTCPPDRVALEMRLLSARIGNLLTDPPVPDQQRKDLAAILAAFFRIHPYRDGNGRIARILVRRVTALLQLPLNDRWTLEPRGYGAGMSLAIESFPLSPRPLETYLKRFFG